jgi:hypothetical protein
MSLVSDDFYKNVMYNKNVVYHPLINHDNYIHFLLIFFHKNDNINMFYDNIALLFQFLMIHNMFIHHKSGKVHENMTKENDLHMTSQ